MTDLNDGHSKFTITKNRNRVFGAMAALLIPFSVYVYFLCPTIATGDTTELINCAATLGIPHAPGYPLFTMLGHVFTWIPINSVAWRVNLSSAVFSALACMFVYFSVVQLTDRIWSGLAAAWSLGFSRFFWHYAEVAEVFPLNSLFVALITYTLIRFTRSLESVAGRREKKLCFVAGRRARYFFWLFCLLCGLALTNHHTIILLAPGALFLLWFSCPQLFQEGKTLAVGTLLFFLGLLPYAYCPLAAMANPLLNWGNPVNLNNFLRLLLRMDFGTFSLTSMKQASSRASQFYPYFAGLYCQFTPLGIGLAILGFLEAKRFKGLQIYLSVGFLFTGLFFVLFANYPIHKPLLLGVLHRFYIMSAVLFSFWIGFGMKRLLVWMEHAKPVARVNHGMTPVLLTLGLLTWQFVTNVKEADFRADYMAEDFVYNVLLCLPENSLFFVQGDVASMGMNYFQAVLGQRRDVITLDQEKLTYPWYYEQAKARFADITLPGKRYDGVNVLNLHLISHNVDKRSTCFRFFKEDSYKREFRTVPMGLVDKMIPRSLPYSLEKGEEDVNRLYASFKRRGWENDYPPTSFERIIKGYYANPLASLGDRFRMAGNIEKAVRYYRRALEIDMGDSTTIKNLAILLLKKTKQTREAMNLFKRYLELNPDGRESEQIKRVIELYGRQRSCKPDSRNKGPFQHSRFP